MEILVLVLPQRLIENLLYDNMAPTLLADRLLHLAVSLENLEVYYKEFLVTDEGAMIEGQL
jgi:hypothetical protein